ncbi:MAG: hypothetical protein AAGB29_01345 [Planctomycetota bacterium]
MSRLAPRLAAVLLAALAAAPVLADAADRAYRDALLTRLEAAQAEHRDAPDSLDARVAVARAWYALGVEGEKKAAKRAEELFDELHQDDPDDPVITAYLGSCRLLHAKREWAPWRKYELSKEGVTLLNQAVDSAPDDLHARFIRAATTENLPAQFELSDQADADFATLAERVYHDRTHPGLDGEQAAYALARHAVRLEAAQNHGDALIAYRLAVEFAPDSRTAAKAAESIERIEAFYTPTAESSPANQPTP